jgi:hypothetical protein
MKQFKSEIEKDMYIGEIETEYRKAHGLTSDPFGGFLGYDYTPEQRAELDAIIDSKLEEE